MHGVGDEEGTNSESGIPHMGFTPVTCFMSLSTAVSTTDLCRLRGFGCLQASTTSRAVGGTHVSLIARPLSCSFPVATQYFWTLIFSSTDTPFSGRAALCRTRRVAPIALGNIPT
ncbi:unnamed protein product [Scytosiphon promiscuus]